jgi:hypothetical protein
MPFHTVVTSYHPVNLYIDAVLPGEPVEGTAIRVRFTLTNARDQEVSGTVQFEGRTDAELGPSTAVIDLAPGQSAHGSVVGLAPRAGISQEVKLAFYEKDAFPGVEFPPPTAAAATDIDIAARYQVKVDWFLVKEARSPLHDTLTGTCRVLFGGAPLPSCHLESPLDVSQESQTQDFGDHGDGDQVETKFCFGPFSGVPGIAPDLELSYMFYNGGFATSGEKELNEALDILSTIGAAVATILVPQGAPAWPLANEAHKKVNAALLQDCDGLVAGDMVTARSSVLEQLTAANGGYSETRQYKGTPSPAGCGATSEYEVRFSFVRLSFFGL